MGAFHSTPNFGWYIKWNGPFRFGPTRILETSLVKVVHFERSSHFGRSDRNVPFHLTVPLFCILLTRTYQTSGGLGRVCAIEMYRSIGHVEFPKFQTGFARGGGWGTWDNFCWVCAAGLSEPLPHYSLFCGQL